MKTMADRTVLVTGAAKRLGREIALYFAREGWNVIIHYGQSTKEAKAVVDEMQSRCRQIYHAKQTYKL
jgi:NAD(P)-dependent dehydrogenase (short-subunit alcohol dehydrogenase family)